MSHSDKILSYLILIWLKMCPIVNLIKNMPYSEIEQNCVPEGNWFKMCPIVKLAKIVSHREIGQKRVS